jgi:CRP-like cAMP-binding protein
VIERLIRKLEHHEPLSDEEKRALETAPSRVDNYKRHDVIIAQGDRPSEVCLVLEGVVGRTKILANGGRQILGFEIAGDLVDLHSLFLKGMDHGLEALASARIAKVPHKTVRNLMERYPRLALAFAWDMALDGAIQREWMASMGRRSAYEQTAHVLCELLIRLRAVGLAPDNQYDLHMTQEDLADAFGISAVHVNRMLQALRRDGLIELKASLALKILDIQGLKDAAGFEPAYLQ